MTSKQKKTVRIVYLSNSTIPSRHANSIQVMKMCQSFALLGHDVTLIVPRKKEVEKLSPESTVYSFYGVEPVFDIVEIANPSIIGGTFLFGLLSALKAVNLKADLVYGRSLASITFSSLLGKKASFEAHYPGIENRNKGLQTLLGLFFRNNHLKAIVCISEAVQKEIHDKYKVAGKKLMTAPDGADPVYEPEKISSVALKKRPDSRLQVGYVGHLYKGKAMELISQLAVQCPKDDFHIVGGTEKDLNYWKKKTQAYGNLHFYGFIPHGELTGYFRTFDIVLAPYQQIVYPAGSTRNISQWMSPLKIFESMAHGKALICSDLPVLKEVLTHGQEALMCAPEDVEAWAQTLDRLERDVALRRRLGENARHTFLQHYTWKSRGENILRFIQENQ